MKIAFPEEQIATRVREMAEVISGEYGSEPVHAFALLENAFMFHADLVRRLTCPVVCHFVKMEWMDTAESGHQPRRNIVYGPLGNVAGKNILVVDVLVESGITLDYLTQQLLSRKPKTLRIAALVDREDRRRVPVRLDYCGFPWSGNHLVGYGLDKEGLYRNLPYLGEVVPERQPVAVPSAPSAAESVQE